MTDNVFKTMNSAWQRGKVQQADLDVFADQGAKVPGVLYRMAGNGKLTMDWLLRYWEKNATNPMDTPDMLLEAYGYQSPTDQVDHPDHYQAGGMETIDIIDAYVEHPVSFSLGNVIKYVTRAGRKTGETATKDLAKARWYLDHALTQLGETK